MLNTLAITLPFFALVGCGYLAGRHGVLGGKDNTAEAVKGLNMFVLHFALPALLFRTTATRGIGEMFEGAYVLAFFLAGLITFAATALVGRALFNLNAAESALQGQAGSVGNVGFLALPLLLALLGEEAGAPIVLGWMVDMVLLVPLSITVIEATRHHGQGNNWLSFFAKVAKGVVFNPFVLWVVAGVAYSAAGLPLVKPLDTVADLLAKAAGPAALFALGATLSARPLSESLGEATYLSLAKLLVYPAIMWVMMTQVFNIDAFWATVAILVAAAPVAGNVYIIASGYGIYMVRASSAILVSTGLAVVTFSVLTAMLVN